MQLRSYLVFTLFSLVSLATTAQQSFSDSVSTLLLLPPNNPTPDTARINLLVAQGKALVYENPDSARVYFHYAVRLATQLESGRQQATALNWMGVAYYILGEYNSALPYFTKSLRLNEQHNDHFGMATSLNHIGLIYSSQGQHARAIAQHLQAIRHAEAIGNQERMASNYFNIGLIYDETKEYDKAFEYITKALQLSEQGKHHRLIAMCYNRLGETHFHLGNFKEAERYYQKALSYPAYQNNWETCFALAGLAQTLSATGDYNKALEYGLKSYRLARKIKAKWEVIRVADILAQTYARKKDFSQAFTLQQVARQLSDSVFNEEKERELNYIHLQENEVDRLRLSQQNELQQAELRVKNLYILLACSGGLLLFVLAFVLYARHQQKLRSNRVLTAINQRIEEQNRELNELNQTKSNLLSIVGHDMRSPFINLGALLHIMRDGDLDADQQQKFLTDLQVAADSVSETLDNLLQWSASQMEGQQTNPVIVDLDNVLESQIKFWQLTADRKGIALEHRKQALNVRADVDHVRTIMRNIIGNAIKFTPAQGRISISYRQHAGMIGIVITDTGIGMTDDLIQELFVFNVRRRKRGTDNEKGTGIGLMICKQFVEKNNGKIKVESQPGKGTTFTTWLPAAD